MSPKEKFCANSFLPVIDPFVQSLSDKISAYDIVCERFEFFSRLEDMDAEISSNAVFLVRFYKVDVESSPKDELVHFVELVKLDIKEYNEKIP